MTDDERPMTDDERPTTDDERPMTDEERPMTDDERPIPDEERQIPAFFIHSVTRKPVGEQDACWRPAIEPSNSQALVLGIERRHTQRAAHPNAPLARSVRGFSEISDNAGILSDIIRRQAIVFQGVQSKLSYVLGIVMNVVRVALVAIGLYLLYDFLHDHHFGLIASFHDPDNWLGRAVASTPRTDYWIGVLILMGAVLAIYIAGRVKHRLAAHTVRLPSGRLDT